MSNSFEGITTPDPGPGKIVVWNQDPRSPTYGHIEVITTSQARHYRREARRVGRRRRIQQIARWFPWIR